MPSFFNSLFSCSWPTEQSYSRLSQSEPGEPGQSLTPCNGMISNTSRPTDGPSQLYEPTFGINGQHPKSWRILLRFASNTDDIGKVAFKPDLKEGWDAVLDIVTTDIVGLMKEGLYVSQNDVQVDENCITWVDNTEGQQRVYFRHYTLVHSKWSGKLVVGFGSLDNVPKFRVENLSAERVYHTSAVAMFRSDNNKVYYYEAGPPHDRMNLILDDEPLPGLWPWPKKEPDNRRESEESYDMVET